MIRTNLNSFFRFYQWKFKAHKAECPSRGNFDRYMYSVSTNTVSQHHLADRNSFNATPTTTRKKKIGIMYVICFLSFPFHLIWSFFNSFVFVSSSIHQRTMHSNTQRMQKFCVIHHRVWHDRNVANLLMMSVNVWANLSTHVRTNKCHASIAFLISFQNNLHKPGDTNE